MDATLFVNFVGLLYHAVEDWQGQDKKFTVFSQAVFFKLQFIVLARERPASL